jgi:peptide deformylase
MSALPIRTLGDPVLREPAREVDAFDDYLRRLYRDMVDTMRAAPGVGLAAPQVGLSLRFFVFDAGEGQPAGAIANPLLSEFEGEQREEEGCLSISGLWYETPRAMRVRVDGLDLEGNLVSHRGEGLLARIFQHETDHVNGLMFIDRLPQGDRRKALSMYTQRELDHPSPRPRRSRTP